VLVNKLVFMLLLLLLFREKEQLLLVYVVEWQLVMVELLWYGLVKLGQQIIQH
jgi:hypothetical protein